MLDEPLGWHVGPVTVRTQAALALVISGLLGCGQASEQAPSGPAAASEVSPAIDPAPLERAIAEPPEPVITRREPVVSAPIPGADEPGPVYFVINTKGVAKLDHSGVTLVLDKPERRLQDLLLGPDGGVYLLDAHSLRKLEGDRVSEVARFGLDEVAPVDSLAIAPDGTIWVTGSSGVGYWAGGEWRISSRRSLGLDFSAALAIAADGTVWVHDANQLLRRPLGSNAWIDAELDSLGSGRLLLNLRAAPGGSVVGTDGARLIRLGTPEHELIPLDAGERAAYTAELSIAADGTIALASRRCAVVRLAPDLAGEPWRFAASDYACVTLEAMAVDAQQRIWVASREGLSVIDRAGEVVEYPAGSLPALAGRVSRMLAVGRGPSLPAVAEPARAAITGRIVIEGEPLANAPIELCPTAELRGDGSPCAGAKLRMLGTTDAGGGFRFEAAPIGDYSFAVEVEGQWRWITPPSFAARLVAGEVFDMGSLPLARL